MAATRIPAGSRTREQSRAVADLAIELQAQADHAQACRERDPFVRAETLAHLAADRQVRRALAEASTNREAPCG